MAQRFGGKYSPTGGSQPGTGSAQKSTTPPNLYDGRRPVRAGAESNILFAVPLIFAIQAFRADPAGLIFGLVATGLTLAAAWLTREGIRAHEAYDMRRVARRPAFPRKIGGAVLMGAGIATAAFTNIGSPVMAVLIGVAGAILHLGAFGADPLKDKGAEGIDGFQNERVARAVDEAETYLSAMKDAILRARDRQLETRVDRFAAAARQLFRTVKSDPGDLSAARKYLTVYLMGARDATVKFADLYAQNRDPQARTDYEALLTDLETRFADRTTALLSNDNDALEVEIQVLRERLEYETPRRD